MRRKKYSLTCKHEKSVPEVHSTNKETTTYWMQQGSQMRSYFSTIKSDMDGWDVSHLLWCVSKLRDEKQDFKWEPYLFKDR